MANPVRCLIVFSYDKGEPVQISTKFAKCLKIAVDAPACSDIFGMCVMCNTVLHQERVITGNVNAIQLVCLYCPKESDIFGIK